MTEAREARAAGVGAAALLLYGLLVVGSGLVDPFQFVRLFLAYAGASMILWLFVGGIFFAVSLLRAARASGSETFLLTYFRTSIRQRWERDRGISILWPPLLFAGLMASFNAFKQMILPSAGFGLDPFLAAADKWLFFGHDGWQVTHAIFSAPWATVAIDRLYHGWFAPMSLGVMLCAWLPASTYRVRTQYLLSYMFIWIGLGSIMAYLTPSAGPCFYSRLVGPYPSYDRLLQRLAEIEVQTGSTLNAFLSQSRLIEAHGSSQLMIGGGISAMPSVHNALAVLFALGAWKFSRPVGYIFGVYAVVIWLGSIHLGWHYALDGIVAALLTFVIWHVSGRIADRLERPLFEPAAAEPALT